MTEPVKVNKVPFTAALADRDNFHHADISGPQNFYLAILKIGLAWYEKGVNNKTHFCV